MLTLITAMSVESSVPTSVAFAVLPFWKRTLIEVAPSTTCAFVTMSPFVSMTKPEPSAATGRRRGQKLGAAEPVTTVMSTTPGAVFL